MSANEERAYIRDLARQVVEIASSPEMETIRKRWRDVNALRKADRPPIWCRPVGAWKELLPDEAIRCQDPWLRSLERGFRQTLIKVEIGDDEPVAAEFVVEAVFDCDPPNVWGVEIGRRESEMDSGAWAYDPPLRREAEFEKLRMPTYRYNPQKTQEKLSRAQDLLGDIMPVRVGASPPLHATLCYYAAALRGLEQVMLDAIAEPHLLHRLMAHLRDAVIKTTKEVEETGLLAPNNSGPMFCSDPFGPARSDGKLTCRNLWVAANSQEFDPVSPAMWEEFLLNYQKPILEMFGLSAYGCCENLTHKIEGVLSIPNLRIFVCSAWTNLERVVERVGTKHVIMWRQKASDVVFPDDVAVLRTQLEDGMKKLRGCYYQIVLRELQTLAGHSDRLHVWTRLAKEIAAKHWSPS